MAADEEVKETVAHWLNGLMANFYVGEDCQASIVCGQIPGLQWRVHRKINLVVTLKLFV
jgi:hypothetical protein